MIGVNTTYVVQLYDDIWSQVFTTDDVDEAKYYVQTKSGKGAGTASNNSAED